MADLSPTARTVFFDALDRPQHERLAFVRVRCAGNDELCREVEALLDAHEAAEGFLVSPVLDDDLWSEAPETDPWLGTLIGEYRLARHIGAGGMSRVYLAEREGADFEHRVAIKLIRRGFDSQETLRRFRTECRALARLQHPNIAGMIDGGVTRDGVPYLVMEYVDGLPIDKHCEEHRLDIGQRLLLFRTVCSAVHYAHRHFIVHRDLKPSNILVDREGHVKLLDFGIARIIDPVDDAGERTTTSVRALTPSYASPEQMRGELLTTATDVYSLGVVLYRLLTGHLPHVVESGSPTDWERVISEEPPTKPSEIVLRSTATSAMPAEGQRVARRLRGDLDVIVLMALRKEPERRYTSVEQFSEDVRLHLAGLPVIAQDDTILYRAGKFIRRHRTGVAAAAAVILSLAVGLGAAVTQARRAVEERDAAEEVSAFLQDLFDSSDPFLAAGSERPDTLPVRAFLTRGADRVRRELDGRPATRARMLQAIGRAYRSLGVFDEARTLLEEALEVRRGLYGPSHEDIAESEASLGLVLYDQGEYEAAELRIRRALAVQRDVLGPDNPEVASTPGALGEVLATQGRYDEAEAAHRASADLRRAYFGPTHVELAKSLTNLGSLLDSRGRDEEAEDVLSEALRISRDNLGERHILVAAAMGNLAGVIRKMGRYQEAEALQRESLDITRELLGSRHPGTIITTNNLAITLQNQGRFEEAEGLFREALALRRDVYGPNHLRVAIGLHNLGLLLGNQGRRADAEQLLRQALDVYRAAVGEDHPNYGLALSALGSQLQGQGKLDAAEQAMREGLAQRRRVYGEMNERVSVALSNLAGLLRQKGEYSEAEELAHHALEIVRTVQGEEHPAVGFITQELADIRNGRGDRPGAIELYRRALDHLDGKIPPTHVRFGLLNGALGSALMEESQYADAESALLESYRILAESERTGSPRLRDAARRLADLYNRWGRPADAERYRSEIDRSP